MSGTVDNIYIKNKIDAYSEIISKLQELLSDKKKDLIAVRLQELKESESRFCLYRDGFLYRYLGFLPHFKNKYRVMQTSYRSSSEKFRQQICTSLATLKDFYKFDDIRMMLCLDTPNECATSHKFILPYELCSDVLKKYYDKLNHLLNQSRDELDELKNSIIDVWGGQLSTDVVSSLKVLVKVFSLPEVKYDSLVKLHNKASNDLDSLKKNEQKIKVELLEVIKKFSQLKRLSKESFANHNKSCINHFKDVNDADSKMINLISEKKQNESKQTELSSVVFHLSTVLEKMPSDYTSLNFKDFCSVHKVNVLDNSSSDLKQILNSNHLENVPNYSLSSSIFENVR